MGGKQHLPRRNEGRLEDTNETSEPDAVFEEMSGWADITDQIEKANRKGKKKHG